MTHSGLCKIGSKWLKQHPQNTEVPNCRIVCNELIANVSNGEEPDIIGWCYWTSILIEVKVSKSDFLKDRGKIFRQVEGHGMGEFRYYLCPNGLLKGYDIPENWGLLYCDGKKIEIIKTANRVKANLSSEKTMLLGVIRRLVKKPQVFDFKNSN